MSNKDDNAGFFLVLGLFLALPLAAWSGYILTIVWQWFIVPLGVVPIGMWHASGIFLVASWLTKNHDTESSGDRSSSERFAAAVARGVLMPLLMLGFGALYHGLMP